MCPWMEEQSHFQWFPRILWFGVWIELKPKWSSQIWNVSLGLIFCGPRSNPYEYIRTGKDQRIVKLGSLEVFKQLEISSVRPRVSPPMGALGRWRYSLRIWVLPVAEQKTLKIIRTWHAYVLFVCIHMHVYVYIHVYVIAPWIISYYIGCRLTSVFIPLSQSVWFSSEGGAPNYYPNSFSGPAEQPNAIEHGSRCSADVQRFNSANEDNVTQVMTSSSARRVTRSVSLLVSAYFTPSQVSNMS